MIILSAVIIAYGSALFGFLYFLIRHLDGQEKVEQFSSSQVTSDAAKRTLQSIKNVDQKEINRQSELGILFIESMKATLDKLNASSVSEDKYTGASQTKVKTREQNKVRTRG